MNDEIRLRKFLVELDQTLQENIDVYIDELGNPIPCPHDENTVYNWMMETEEYHLLTEKKVKAYINLFMSDYESRMKILKSMELV